MAKIILKVGAELEKTAESGFGKVKTQIDSLAKSLNNVKANKEFTDQVTDISRIQSRYPVTFLRICPCSSTYLLPSSSRRSPPTSKAGSGPYRLLSFWPAFSPGRARTR